MVWIIIREQRAYAAFSMAGAGVWKPLVLDLGRQGRAGTAAAGRAGGRELGTARGLGGSGARGALCYFSLFDDMFYDAVYF